MKRGGRVHIMIPVAIVATVGAVIVLFTARADNETVVTQKFFRALAKQDLEQLMSVSYLSGRDPAEVRKQWEQTLAWTKHYSFSWDIRSASNSGPNEAMVRVGVWKNFAGGASYDEKFEVPLVKRDGRWLVDVFALSRKMHPGLPR